MKHFICAIAMLTALSVCTGCRTASLEETEWKLIELDGKAEAAFSAESDTFNFTLTAEQHSLHGVGACNRFFGNYSVGEDNRLKLDPMGMTRMACPDMELEDKFIQTLLKVDKYSIKGDRLTLYDGIRKLAELQAVAVQAE